MSNARFALVAFMVAAMAGCSTVKFYELDGGKEVDKGFLYYPPRPYVLIERGEHGYTTSLISLPDTSRPHRVRHHARLGTAEMGFTLENGMIKTFNSKSDSKTPETITALTGIATAKAALITAEAAYEAATKEIEPATTVMILAAGESGYDVTVVIEAIRVIESEVIEVLTKAPTPSFFSDPIQRLQDQVHRLAEISKVAYPDGKIDVLLEKLGEYKKKIDSINGQLRSVSNILKIIGSDAETYPMDFSVAIHANENLSKVIKKLDQFLVVTSSVEGLYEIDYVNDQLSLRKVTIQ